MRTPPTLLAISGAIILFGMPALGNAFTEQALYIDGKMRTEGIPFEGVQVAVERDGILVQTLSGPVGRLQLKLDLQWVYVLTFEREGCLSKQLLFDTHVPFDGLDAGPFNFPFKVTLEANDMGEEFHYAQPVGFIRYFRDKRDFAYDTDYTLGRDPLAKMEEYSHRVSRLTTAPDPTTSASLVITNVAVPAPSAPEASNVSANPAPAEEIVVALAINEVAPPVAPLLQRKRALLSTPDPVLVPVAFVRPAPVHAPVAAESFAPAAKPKPVVTRIVRIPPPEKVVLPEGRMEELVVEPTYIAKIVRITNDGRTREFRRIVHKYGDVNFFCTGSSCSESAFIAGTKQP